MPKATLEFDLPGENSEYETVMQAGKMSSALWEIQNHIRTILKYQSDQHSEEYLKAYEDLRKVVYDACEGIDV